MTDQEKQQEVRLIQPVAKISPKVQLTVTSLELAKISSGYTVNDKVYDRKTKIFINDGKEYRENSILASYIWRAEQLYIQEHSSEIMEKAKELLQEEVEYIKELVNE